MYKSFETLNLLKSIKEIDNILNQYHQLGYIDRDKAISKIKELRVTNKNVYEAAIEVPLSNLIPFVQASDEQLVHELELYKMILTENYMTDVKEMND